MNNSNPVLDDIDLRILDALQKDSTLSTSDLAEAEFQLRQSQSIHPRKPDRVLPAR